MQNLELTKEQKKTAIEDIREYFASERDEEIGELAARLILDFFLEKIGPHIYNQAITDTQKYLNDRIDDMYSLMK